MTDEKKFPYVTQHCANGGHEGAKTLTAKGTMIRPCNWRYVFDFGVTVECSCKCHEITAGLAAMVEQMGRTYTMPPTVIEPAAEVEAIRKSLVDIRKPEFDSTPTGRLAPGQLERWVLDVVERKPIGGLIMDINYIIFEVSLAHPGYRPSAGAIQAVLQKWADMHYIKLETKPLRVEQVYESLQTVRQTRPLVHRPLFGSR
jgi:hypothetical protein